jgi:hypothetical protein
MLDPRIYQAGLVPAVLALAVAAFSLEDVPSGATTTLAPDAFNGQRATRSLQSLAREFPDRRPDSPGDRALAGRVAETFRSSGFRVRIRRDEARTIDGERRLRTVVGLRAGTTPRRIVVLAHRDSADRQATADLSGTAGLLELAKVFEGRTLSKTIVLVSTSGGSGGAGGAAAYAQAPGGPVDAVLVLGDLASHRLRSPLSVPWSNDATLAPPRLRRTVEEAMRVELGRRPGETRGLAQVARLALPYAPTEQGEIVDHGVPAVLISASGERGPGGDNAVDGDRLQAFGRTVLRTITALDEEDKAMPAPSGELLIRRKVVPGWAVSLLVAALILPVLFVAVDGFARVRRRRERTGMWLAWTLSAAVPFALTALFAVALRAAGWVDAPAAPSPAGAVPVDWPVLAVVALAFALAWAGLRPLLLRWAGVRGQTASEGAAAAALLVFCATVVALWAINPFSALLALPALHAWLAIYSSGLRLRRPIAFAIVVLTLIPPALVILYYALHLGLGPDQLLWQALLLAAGGQVGVFTLLTWSLGLGCLACTLAVARARPAEGGPRSPAPRTRGPISYAGPGSLGGTDSALRR